MCNDVCQVKARSTVPPSTHKVAGLTMSWESGQRDRNSSRTRLRFEIRQSWCNDRRRRHGRRSRFRGSAVVVHRRDHRHHCLEAEPSKSKTLSANHEDSTVKGFRRSWKLSRLEDSEDHGDSPEIPQFEDSENP